MPSVSAPLELEVISRLPAAQSERPPLLFVHGAFTAAWCWQEHFLDWFASRGYPSYALSLRGHGGSAGREQLTWTRLADYVTDLSEVAVGLGERVVLIGHSMGGMVVQKYLERGVGHGAVLMASVPPTGLMSSNLQMLMRDPLLWSEMSVITAAGPKYGSMETARKALFSSDVPDEIVARLLERAQPESQRVLVDLNWADLPAVPLVARTPMLVLGARNDALVPVSDVQLTAQLYGAESEIFEGMAHAMMFETHWELVAQRIDRWLLERKL